MPSITICNLRNEAYENLNLEIRDREFLVVLGPNGSGKSTLLNIIAGLSAYTGSVRFNGTSIDDVPASKRGVGYMFQNLALFPHLDVASNVAYSLKMNRWSKKRVATRTAEMLRLVNIGHLRSRYPGSLSGGEKQRVALARALAASQTLLLLDEPMSSLDEQTAAYLRVELRQLQQTLGITTIYVSHDLMEAITLGDRLAIILNGRVEQVDEPEQVLFSPCSEAVSEFIGKPNILSCNRCRNTGKGIAEADCSGLRLAVLHEGDEIEKVAILPRHIYISDRKPRGPGINLFQSTITDIIHQEERIRIRLEIAKRSLLAELPYPVFDTMNLSVGQTVFAILRLKRIRILEKNGRLRKRNHENQPFI